ncbi:hypothetical protein ABID21_004318 [Pseudorhizobium tarimense]|uniref:Uncharacterized protein n=1 Tax=Pseudorhizobium tarimense TaxID=1079109 RepID=A0ABV2HCF6_9HYPH
MQRTPWSDHLKLSQHMAWAWRSPDIPFGWCDI